MSTEDLARLAQVRKLIKSGQARRTREAAGISLAEMARAIGVDVSTLHRWETGKRRPRSAAALRYAGALAALEEVTAA